jgi:hypothetical protein
MFQVRPGVHLAAIAAPPVGAVRAAEPRCRATAGQLTLKGYEHVSRGR